MPTLSDVVNSQWEACRSAGLPWWSAFALLAVLLYATRAVCNYTRLRQFDGPFIAKWSRFWMIRSALSGTQNTRLHECNRKYGMKCSFQAFLGFPKAAQEGKLTSPFVGPICRIGPKTLLVSDANFLWKVNGVRSEYIRSVAYTAFSLEPGKNNILSTRDEKRHQQLRAQMAAGVSGVFQRICLYQTDEETSTRAKKTLISSPRLIITFASSWDSLSANTSPPEQTTVRLILPEPRATSRSM